MPNTIPPFSDDGSVLDRIPADETFDGTWPWEPKFFHGNGFAQHYIDEGAGDPIVLLHGEPTWGYLYRNFIPALSKSHRVIVPDHMGFGKSETPQHKEYCLRTHTLNLVNLLDSLQLDSKITFFIQDWGAPMGLHFALRFPEKVARIMIGSAIRMPGTLEEANKKLGSTPDKYGRRPLMRPTSKFTHQKSDRGTPEVPSLNWFPWIKSGLPDDPDYVCPGIPAERGDPYIHPQSRTEAVLLNMGSTVTVAIKHLLGIENSANINETWIRAYSAAFPTPQASVAALNFPMDACGQLKLSPEAQAFPHEAVNPQSVAAVRALPIWMVVGRKDHAISVRHVTSASKSLGNCPYVILENAGHFIQEDCPETLVAMLQTFIQATGGGSPPLSKSAGVPPPSTSKL